MDNKMFHGSKVAEKNCLDYGVYTFKPCQTTAFTPIYNFSLVSLFSSKQMLMMP